MNKYTLKFQNERQEKQYKKENQLRVARMAQFISIAVLVTTIIDISIVVSKDLDKQLRLAYLLQDLIIIAITIVMGFCSYFLKRFIQYEVCILSLGWLSVQLYWIKQGESVMLTFIDEINLGFFWGLIYHFFVMGPNLLFKQANITVVIFGVNFYLAENPQSLQRLFYLLMIWLSSLYVQYKYERIRRLEFLSRIREQAVRQNYESLLKIMPQNFFIIKYDSQFEASELVLLSNNFAMDNKQQIIRQEMQQLQNNNNQRVPFSQISPIGKKQKNLKKIFNKLTKKQKKQQSKAIKNEILQEQQEVVKALTRQMHIGQKESLTTIDTDNTLYAYLNKYLKIYSEDQQKQCKLISQKQNNPNSGPTQGPVVRSGSKQNTYLTEKSNHNGNNNNKNSKKSFSNIRKTFKTLTTMRKNNQSPSVPPTSITRLKSIESNNTNNQGYQQNREGENSKNYNRIQITHNIEGKTQKENIIIKPFSQSHDENYCLVMFEDHNQQIQFLKTQKLMQNVKKFINSSFQNFSKQSQKFIDINQFNLTLQNPQEEDDDDCDSNSQEHRQLNQFTGIEEVYTLIFMIESQNYLFSKILQNSQRSFQGTELQQINLSEEFWFFQSIFLQQFIEKRIQINNIETLLEENQILITSRKAVQILIYNIFQILSIVPGIDYDFNFKIQQTNNVKQEEQFQLIITTQNKNAFLNLTQPQNAKLQHSELLCGHLLGELGPFGKLDIRIPQQSSYSNNNININNNSNNNNNISNNYTNYSPNNSTLPFIQQQQQQHQQQYQNQQYDQDNYQMKINLYTDLQVIYNNGKSKNNTQGYQPISEQNLDNYSQKRRRKQTYRIQEDVRSPIVESPRVNRMLKSQQMMDNINLFNEHLCVSMLPNEDSYFTNPSTDNNINILSHDYHNKTLVNSKIIQGNSHNSENMVKNSIKKERRNQKATYFSGSTNSHNQGSNKITTFNSNFVFNPALSTSKISRKGAENNELEIAENNCINETTKQMIQVNSPFLLERKCKSQSNHTVNQSSEIPKNRSISDKISIQINQKTPKQQTTSRFQQMEGDSNWELQLINIEETSITLPSFQPTFQQKLKNSSQQNDIV